MSSCQMNPLFCSLNVLSSCCYTERCTVCTVRRPIQDVNQRMEATVAGQAERTRRRPGNRAGLDAGRVLEAARDLTRQGGVEALTMRRLASALGVAPNALYSHYSDKSALLDAVLDSLLSEVEVSRL